MMDIRPIRNTEDYDWAVAEIEQYFENEPDPGTPEADRFDVLTTLIAAYDDQHYRIDPIPPVEVLRSHMRRRGLKQADLSQVLGSRSRATEVLKGSRNLSRNMIAALSEQWGIPAQRLLLSPKAVVAVKRRQTVMAKRRPPKRSHSEVVTVADHRHDPGHPRPHK